MIVNMQLNTNKTNKRLRKWVVVTIIGVLIIALGIGTYLFVKARSNTASASQQLRTSKVVKGNIEVSLSGSGTVESSSTAELMANVQGKITKAYFKEGDTVKKGDLLFEIDDTDAKLNIQKIENSISQAQLSVNSTTKNYTNLTVNAPFDGKVSGVSSKVGDNVNNGMTLLTITDTTNLELAVPINVTDVSKVRLGQKVDVHIQELTDTVQGTVTAIDSNSYIASTGGTVKNVTVHVTNPGRITDEMTASVDINVGNDVVSSTQNCQFSFVNKQTIKALASGTIDQLNVKDNQYVSAGQLLIQLTNDDLQVTAQSNELKVADLENQLAAAQKQLLDYKIYSTIDGIMTKQSAYEGDSIKAGSALASIRDYNQMQFTISVDELDIDKIKVGQKAQISFDALTETATNPVDGEVIEKAMEGTSSNGVATYDVTVKINDTKNVLAGMNANAKIILQSKEDILMVPLEAITKMGDMAFVRVQSDGTDADIQTGGRPNFNGGNMPQRDGTAPSGGTMPQRDGTAPSGGTMPQRDGTAPSGGTMPQRDGIAPSGGTMPQRDGTASSDGTMPQRDGTASSDGKITQGDQASDNSKTNDQSTNKRSFASSDTNNQSTSNKRTTQSSSNSTSSTKNAMSTANQGYYANTTMKMVELGINNEQYVEITSGLSEGDVVVLPPLVTSSSSNTNTNNQSGIGFGGMGMGSMGGMGGMSAPPDMSRNFPSGGANRSSSTNRSN